MVIYYVVAGDIEISNNSSKERERGIQQISLLETFQQRFFFLVSWVARVKLHLTFAQSTNVIQRTFAIESNIILVTSTAVVTRVGMTTIHD